MQTPSHLTRIVIIVLSTAILTLVAPSLVPGAGQPEAFWPTNVRYQDKSSGKWVNTLVNVELQFENAPYDSVRYTPTDWCGNRAHATRFPAPDGKKFVHNHNNFSVDGKRGITDDAKLIVDPVTTAMADAAWDYMYGDEDFVKGALINNVAGFGTTIDWVPYTQQGSVDFTMNCWGYAFGYNMWVQDPTYTWNYDYAEVTNCKLAAQEDTPDLIRIRGVVGSPPESAGGDTHVVKITSVCHDPYSGAANCTKVNATIEKNANSNLYLRGNLCNRSYLALFGKHKVYRKIPSPSP